MPRVSSFSLFHKTVIRTHNKSRGGKRCVVCLLSWEGVGGRRETTHYIPTQGTRFRGVCVRRQSISPGLYFHSVFYIFICYPQD